MRSAGRLGWLLVLLGLTAGASGCRERACTPGVTQACLCAGAISGAQVCSAEGDRWGECMCTATIPVPQRSKVAECNDLIEITNKGVQSLEAGQRSGADAIATMRTMADTMDRVATKAGELTLATPQLQKLAHDYRDMARDIAKAARGMADAMEARDQERISAAQAAMERAIKEEDPLIDALNKYRQAP